MKIVYEENDPVEFRGIIWNIQHVVNSYYVDLRNKAGGTVEDVSVDQLKPTRSAVESATSTAQRN